MSQLKVLIVDDEMVNRTYLKTVISRNGYDVYTASSGEEALDVVGEVSFHCILLDILMPGLTGFDVIRILKKNPEYGDVPVIFITGEDDPESIALGFEYGAADYVTKPFHSIEILARIRSHIKLYQTIQSLAQAQVDTLQQIQQVQESMLILPTDFEKASFDVIFKSLHAAGGDIYEVLDLGDGSMGYFVGDFSGHSISTGFLTSSVRALLRQNCKGHYSPRESMRLVNSVLCKLMPIGMYVTAVYVVVAPNQKVTIISMGHPPVLYISKGSQTVQPIRLSGDVLGVFEDALFKEVTFSTLVGDTLLLYTDGVIEGREVWSSAIVTFVDLVKKGSYKLQDSLGAFLDEVFTTSAPLREGGEDDILLLAITIEGGVQQVEEFIGDDTCTVTFPSSIHLIEAAVEKAFTYVKTNLKGFEVGDQYALRLVLHEACANAIKHGNRGLSSLTVTLIVEVDSSKLALHILDEGVGFNWKKALIKSEQDKSRESGRGLLLFKEYGYAISYKRNGSELILSKDFS